MIDKQKELDLEKYHIILLATLNYLGERNEKSIIYDDFDPLAEYYQKQKKQTEQNFKQKRLDRLQKRFISLTKGLENRIDLKFSAYIKDKTGYEVDIFDNLEKRIEAILAIDKIFKQQDLNDVLKALELYKQRSIENEKIEKLSNLLTKYAKDQSISKPNNITIIKKIAKVTDDGTEEITTTETINRKSFFFEEEKQISPDGKRNVRTTKWSNKHNAGTYVSIDFPSANGSIYATIGIQPIVKSWWKDNSTIVIETGKELTAHTQHQKVSSFEDVINIEYILH